MHTLRLPARLMILGSLFLVEILAVSVWLDAEVLRGRGVLASAVHDWGAWTIHLGVALVLGSLIFAESRAQNQFERISTALAARELNWTLLGVHIAVFAAFVALSSIVFHHNQSDPLMLLWGLTGFASLALAACAIIPASSWADLFRSTGDAWIYGLAGALIACTLGLLAQKLWTPLSHWTLSLVALMLRPFVPVLVEDPSTMMIGTPAFHEAIAQQCSGYEGMGLILAFSSAWLWFFRKQWRFPNALILLPAGVAVMYVVNSMRIAALILIGNAGAPQIALGGFHSQAGWMGFNAVAIGTCLIARRIPALVKTVEPEAPNPTIPYLLPFLAILGAAMISRALSGTFEWFYPLRVAAAAATLVFFRKSYKSVDFRFGPVGILAGVAVFALWIAMEPSGYTAPGTTKLWWIAFRVVGAVALVPIAEELAFRGFLLRRLADADFESVGWKTFSLMPFLVSSAAFGILHGERWIAGTLAGAIFALAQLRKGRLGDAIAAHAVANALLAAWVLTRGNWQAW